MRIRLAIAATFVVAAASACGGSAGSGGAAAEHPVDTLKVLGAAADTTDAASSVRLSGTMTEHLVGVELPTTGTPTTVDFSATMQGDVQTEPLAARLTVSDLTSGGQSVPGDVEELMTPDAIYMKMPSLAASTGKPWIVMRFADLKRMSGVDLGQMLSQVRQMQPGQYLRQLMASGHVSELGTEDVAGVSTTHFGGVVPVADMIAHLDGSIRKVSGDLMRSAGITETHIDVWIDDAGLVRHVVSHATGDGNDNEIDIDLTMQAYDVTVDATPPPASQVADLAELSTPAG